MPETSTKFIHIRGARTHNLRDVSLDIPRDQLVVITGLSGSGKSSLAFDTIYAEGQRKYVESLSAYARQFLGQMIKPDVEQITGLPPTIAIAQQSVRANPRSTVATATELYDFLRLLFARVGQPTCPKCGKAVARQTRAQIVEAILALPGQTKVMILAPLVRNQKGEHKAVLSRIQREGFVRVRIDGELFEAKEAPKLDPAKTHRIDAVVDRIIVKSDVRSRVAESVETSLKVADGLVVVASAAPNDPDRWRDETYSERFACTECDVRLPPLEPRLFSFNSPHGACPECDGLGIVLEFDPAAVVPDPGIPLEAGAIAPWGRSGKGLTPIHAKLLKQFCEAFKVPPGAPYSALSAPLREILLWGTKSGDEQKHGHHFEGVIPNLKRRWAAADSDALKTRLHEFMSQRPCPSCKGARLRPEALAVRIDGRNIDEIAALSIDAAAGVFSSMQFTGADVTIAAPIIREIRQRLQFMIDVGIGYLTLSRSAATLSGGEAQRIRLATQVGSGLVGVCYVLDEPTIGLHQRDNARLIRTLRQLTDLGNTVLVVEHDVEAIAAADWIVDVGPGAGAHGGRILVNGPRAELLASKESITAQYVRGQLAIAMPSERRPVSAKKAIEIKGAAENNLKSIDVRFPLGVFCCVTGVSGSGKSSLVSQVLLPALRRKLSDSREPVGAHRQILGISHIDKVIEIDQSPIGRSPRSNPATYTGVFDLVRQLFAKTREAKVRGYVAQRFSFNVRGGRCEACQGQGTRRIEMHFLPDIFVPCAECKGSRYSPETLEIKYRGKSIADILEMRVEEALAFFEPFANIMQLLTALSDVGLAYIALGQAASTLSGGEAQRVKLAAELGKTAVGHTLYILDEPTTGLHFADIHKLVDVLNRLVAAGHSLVVIEHNLDVIKQADWIIDLGPEGGDAGGRIVAEGPPEEIAANERSYTGQYLKMVLNRSA
ncbi:MAG TPA: excinuclease ABC subunit UvrA [Phycisphaerae bacterium]|nr:excinuclease ABC subunit UvrA [Phycisphaerae bacterium]